MTAGCSRPADSTRSGREVSGERARVAATDAGSSALSAPGGGRTGPRPYGPAAATDPVPRPVADPDPARRPQLAVWWSVAVDICLRRERGELADSIGADYRLHLLEVLDVAAGRCTVVPDPPARGER